MSLALHRADGKVIDDFCASINEDFLGKSMVKITSAGHKTIVRNLVVTRQSIHEFHVDARSAAQYIGIDQYAENDAVELADTAISTDGCLKSKSLGDIHSLEAYSATDSTAFDIYFFSGQFGKRMEMSLAKWKRILTVSQQFTDLLKKKTYSFQTPFECSQFYLILNTAVNLYFQALIETNIVKEPEIYQRHAFVVKGSHDRMLIISNKWLYNVDITFKPTLLRSTKWAIPINTLRRLTLVAPKETMASVRNATANEDVGNGSGSSSGGEAELIIECDSIRAAEQFDMFHRPMKLQSNKRATFTAKPYSFLFRTVPERNRVVQSLQRLYGDQTDTMLDVVIQ